MEWSWWLPLLSRAINWSATLKQEIIIVSLSGWLLFVVKYNV